MKYHFISSDQLLNVLFVKMFKSELQQVKYNVIYHCRYKKLHFTHIVNGIIGAPVNILPARGVRADPKIPILESAWCISSPGM